MNNIKQIVRRVISETFIPNMVLTENVKISKNLEYHINNKITLSESVFRPYSDGYFNLVCEVRDLYNNGSIQLNRTDRWLIETDLGKMVRLSSGEYVSLDCPYLMTE